MKSLSQLVVVQNKLSCLASTHFLFQTMLDGEDVDVSLKTVEKTVQKVAYCLVFEAAQVN